MAAYFIFSLKEKYNVQNSYQNKWNTHIYSKFCFVTFTELMFSLLRFNLYLLVYVLSSSKLIRIKSTEYYKDQCINIIVATQGPIGGDYLFCRVIYLLCGLGK